MEVLKEYWVFIVPLIIAELALMVAALTHVLRHSNYRFGSRALWIFIVVFFQIIGPLAYFIFGRGVDE
ncbi:MAG TPA: PLDc_N domain-containing protein [Firmicutes bacterium]|nr:PLDc_N domain-containing protein [Bacillota bacterium]